MTTDLINFNKKTPSILVQDDFYKDPKAIVALAEQQEYYEDLRYYKGLRSKPNLFPYVREYFQDLLKITITDWMDQPMNGVFQKTRPEDPIVWHSDTQDYAAAVYLTENADDMGTSFYRHRITGLRHPRNVSDEIINATYTAHDIIYPTNWELVDKVGAVFNRLVIWDAKLIHSASGYRKDRLIQLFFFSGKK